ncbi:MAG TPA: hypothetical protein VI479_13045, partial [Blastocatellia bacterium]
LQRYVYGETREQDYRNPVSRQYNNWRQPTESSQFFTAEILNKNTRRAYAEAVRPFCACHPTASSNGMNLAFL